MTKPHRARPASTNDDCRNQPKPHHATQDLLVAVLAAGESSRMGSCKQLLDFDGETLIERACRSALGIGADEVIVICGRHYEQISNAVCNMPLTCVYNGLSATGQASSIRLAANVARSSNYEWLLLMTSDMPFLSPKHLLALCEAPAKAEATPNGPTLAAVSTATMEGRPMTPCLFGKALFEKLAALRGDTGALKLIRDPRIASSLAFVPFSDPNLAFDIDTPDDYNTALEMLRSMKKEGD